MGWGERGKGYLDGKEWIMSRLTNPTLPCHEQRTQLSPCKENRTQVAYPYVKVKIKVHRFQS